MDVHLGSEDAGEIAYLLEFAKQRLYECQEGHDGCICPHCKVWLEAAEEHLRALDSTSGEL